MKCPACGIDLPLTANFCEGCGADVGGVSCGTCGGSVLEGYCERCGLPGPQWRDHLEDSPADWVAAASDVGRRHARNEDAFAVSATGSRAALVVCDGVSTAPGSDRASLAACTAACGQLADASAGAAGDWFERAATLLNLAAQAALEAVVSGEPADVDPSSCTFVAAVAKADRYAVCNVGDSRGYWIPDNDPELAIALGTDDSMVQELIRSGLTRADAERAPQAHTITRWLGRDAPTNLRPHHASGWVASSGYLLLCTDGLWNYVSEPADLARLVQSFGAQTTSELAAALVSFANDQGGVDNITVAIARLTPHETRMESADG